MDTTQARRHYEQYLNTLYIQRDMDRLHEFVADDVISHRMPPGVPPGISGVRAITQAWLGGFSEVQYTLESFTQDQGHVETRLVVTGVHTGPFMGLAPTGRRITFVDSSRLRMENGKIVEVWANTDIPALMQQLS